MSRDEYREYEEPKATGADEKREVFIIVNF